MAVRKKMIKIAAKIYAASAVRGLLETGASSDKLTDDEHEYLNNYLGQLADIISVENSSGIDESIDIAIRKTNLMNKTSRRFSPAAK